MDLVARHRVEYNELIKKAERPGEKDQYRRVVISAGHPFKVETEEEGKALIRSGAARASTENERKRGAAEPVDYEKMTVPELRELAATRGLELSREQNTKAEIIAALKKHG